MLIIKLFIIRFYAVYALLLTTALILLHSSVKKHAHMTESGTGTLIVISFSVCNVRNILHCIMTTSPWLTTQWYLALTIQEPPHIPRSICHHNKLVFCAQLVFGKPGFKVSQNVWEGFSCIHLLLCDACQFHAKPRECWVEHRPAICLEVVYHLLQLCADKDSWKLNDFMPVNITQTTIHTVYCTNAGSQNFTSSGATWTKPKFPIFIFSHWDVMLYTTQQLRNKNQILRVIRSIDLFTCCLKVYNHIIWYVFAACD